MVDDFWGDDEFENFLEQMKTTSFPKTEYEPEELPARSRDLPVCLSASRKNRKFPASTPGRGRVQT